MINRMMGANAFAWTSDLTTPAANFGALAPSPKAVDGPLATGLTDQHADNITTTATITVDGAHVVASIDALGDQDFFRVDLVAGQTYNIGQYLAVGGPLLTPLADAYLELYDSAGNLVATADGGGPNTPSGLDALLTFTADGSGTYFINARAFDQDATNGSTGDHIGDYELFVDTTTLSPTTYRPFYDTSSPLHSLDWGSQIDRTSRNPDGENGTRPNAWAPDGNGPILTNNYGIEGKNVVTYYFAKQGDVFLDEEPGGLATMLQAQNMQQWEKDAFRQALDLYEQVADVLYIEVDNRNEADFKFITYEGTPGVGASLLGRMSPPNEANEGQMEINAGDVRWTEEGVQQGGFYFPTLIHELGHGHGMSHPHDNGGRSSIMPGADGGTGGLGGGFGDWGLSQQVFTIMSYNDGWNEEAPYGARPAGHGGPRSGGITGTEVDHFGWQGTLAALDIAVIQDKYGVNEEWARGNDVYEIKDFNGAGNFYSTIWDGGGTDEIRYSGSADATIDLRAASLQYEEGGGGRMSYAMGLWGGFTIANGVEIENATGGSGADSLTGSSAANVLTGGLGNDQLDGLGGADTLAGGDGIDTVTYANSNAGVTVRLWNGTGLGGHAQGDVLSGVENLVGSSFNDYLIGGEGASSLTGGAGDDYLDGLGGADVMDGGDGVDVVNYANSTAAVTVRLWGGTTTGGFATGDVLSNIENAIGSAFNDYLIGSSAANQLTGGAGIDYLDGMGGSDVLTGGSGNDAFQFRGASGSDTITDFSAGAAAGDVIRLDTAVFFNFSDVLANATDTANGVVIAKGGVSITLTGVLKGQLNSNDFEFAAAPAPAISETKDGSLTLPDVVHDDPLILPADFGPLTKGMDDALILPPAFDGTDPLILPAGLEAKQAPDDVPVICPPGDDAQPVARPDWVLAEMGLSNFDGRDPHRFLLEPRGMDWIV